MHSILFFCLKIQMARCSGRPGPGVLPEEAEERMFCFRPAESALFFMLSLVLSFPNLTETEWRVADCSITGGQTNQTTHLYIF